MLCLKSESVEVEIAPQVGGRITSFRDRRTGYEFLWRNSAVPLRREAPGTEYDPNFFGGIDELMPNDMPEAIEGIECPDHGELWTQEFQHKALSDSSVALTARLPKFDFEVVRVVEVIEHSCRVFSRVTNLSGKRLPFLWKLHVALNIKPGDVIDCAAEEFTSADPEWSRRNGSGKWEGETVPAFDNTTELLYLHPLWNGYMSWRRNNKKFDVRFDKDVFPYAWYFASYGGFDGHHVGILEPCTAMPISVNDASMRGQCTVLSPGASLETTYTYRGIDED